MLKIYYTIILSLIGQLSFAQFPEGFEGAEFPPTGWVSFTNGNGENYNWTRTDQSYTGNSAAFVRWENVDDGFAEDWLVSPAFTPTEQAHILSFYQKDSYEVNYASEYFVMVSTQSQDDPEDFVELDHQYETDMRLFYTYHEVDLSDYIGQSIYIAFIMTNDDGDDWAIDDVNISSCKIPTNLYADNVAAVGADFYWTDDEADSWEIEVVNFGETPTGIPQFKDITSIPFTWQGGEELMRYSFYVRSDCGNGNMSNYSRGEDFLTSCGNTSCDYLFVLEDSYGDDWNDAYIEIKQNGISVGEITQEEAGFGPFEFYFSFCDEYPFELIWHGGSWDQECIFSFYDLYDQRYYHFEAGDSPEDGSVFYKGEADCDPVTCRFPFDLKSMEYTKTGATLDWTDKDASGTWDIEFVVHGNAPTGLPTVENITQKPYTWSGGDPGTYYDAYVRAVCGPDDRSKWSLANTFSTLCDVVYDQFPFEEGFKSEFDLPDCWSSQHRGRGSQSWKTGPATYSEDTLVYCGFDDKDQDEWLISPAFDFSAAVDEVFLQFDWKMSYYWMVYPYDKGDLNLRVSLDRGKNWSKPIWNESDEELFGTFEWQTSLIDLSEYLGSPEVWLAFQYVANDAATVYLDNFILKDGSGSITGSENVMGQEPEFRIYPNPANDYVNIRGLHEGISQINILDIKGKKVQSIHWPSVRDEKIDLSQLKPGLYLINAVSSEKSFTRKFVKM